MSSKGTSTFIMQRASAALLVPLTVWFLWTFIKFASAGAGYEELRAWASSPVNAAVFTVFILVNVVHMRIGVAEISEDYIHHHGARGLVQTLNWLIALGIAASVIFAAYFLAFAG
jgi:succinate dehydrogenase / fumarate reductase membrane anchor subunit